MDIPRHPILKTIYWNVAGLQNKNHELKAFLQKSDIDIMKIGKTWLKKKNRSFIPNYIALTPYFNLMVAPLC